jgi:hypothetical protein
MKAVAKVTKQGIVIEPDPEELAKEQAKKQLRALAAKASPTNADIMRVLQAVLERLERLEAKLEQ